MLTVSIFAGLLASIVMMLAMQLITAAKIAEADMVRAIGSLITKTMQGCFKVGLFVYLAAGIGFGFFYTFILANLPANSPVLTLTVAVLGGFVHGGLVGFALVAEISNRHPVPRFRNAGFEVAVAHIFGHVVFGLTVALVFLSSQGQMGKLISGIADTPLAIFGTVAVVGAFALIGLSALNQRSNKKLL